jgi:hypothetical protein
MRIIMMLTDGLAQCAHPGGYLHLESSECHNGEMDGATAMIRYERGLALLMPDTDRHGRKYFSPCGGAQSRARRSRLPLPRTKKLRQNVYAVELNSLVFLTGEER